MNWLISVLILAALAAWGLIPIIPSWSGLSPGQQGYTIGYALGFPFGAFIVGIVVQAVWSLLRRRAREARNFHSRVNWTSAILGAIAVFGSYATTAPG